MKGINMKNKIFLQEKSKQFLKHKKCKKKVLKILLTDEKKKSFLSLFDGLEPRFLEDNDRKNRLMEVAKQYFKIKNEIQEERGII